MRSEIALMTTFFVILTLVLNAPLLGPLMTLMGLNKVTKEQLHLRKRVKLMLQVSFSFLYSLGKWETILCVGDKYCTQFFHMILTCPCHVSMIAPLRSGAGFYAIKPRRHASRSGLVGSIDSGLGTPDLDMSAVTWLSGKQESG